MKYSEVQQIPANRWGAACHRTTGSAWSWLRFPNYPNRHIRSDLNAIYSPGTTTKTPQSHIKPAWLWPPRHVLPHDSARRSDPVVIWEPVISVELKAAGHFLEATMVSAPAVNVISGGSGAGCKLRERCLAFLGPSTKRSQEPSKLNLTKKDCLVSS